MGEARRRKQLLGSRYGKLLGLSSAERISLIDQNIAQWISEHFDNCEYHNYLEDPLALQIIEEQRDKSNLEQIIKDVCQHFSGTFNQTYPDASIKLLVRAILEDRPIVFEAISLKQRQELEPTIALQLARKYFQRQVEAGKIQLSTHYILVKEALTVLGGEKKASLLEQLLRRELDDVIDSAQESQALWLMKNVSTDGDIDLSEEVLFQSINTAMAGILTIVATLPWSMQLSFIAD